MIVTDDNPRTEEPEHPSVPQILAAAPGSRIEIGDRPQAIQRGCPRPARPDDLLVIAGKGHETGQIVGATTLPFSDHEVALAAIRDFSTAATDTPAKGPAA